MDGMEHIKDLCLRMEDLASRVGLPRFDRVQLKSDPDELWFLWEQEPKRAIVVELSSNPSERMAAAVAEAVGGDPVLN